MEGQHRALFLAVITCVHSAFSAVSVTGPAAVEQGQDAIFRCSEDPLPDNPLYGWYDETYNNGLQQQLFSGETSYVSGEPKFTNFGVSEGGAVMTITAAAVEDEGPYFCIIQGSASETLDFTVEVRSTLTMTLPTEPVVTGTAFEATCDVVGSRPKLDIEWTLNDIALGVTPVVTNPTNGDQDLSDTKSKVNITATTAMNGQDLKCTTSGHVVTSLNRVVTTQLDVQYAPTSETATIVVDASKEGDNKLRVTCQVSAAVDGIDPAYPAISIYTFYAGSEQIHSSTTDNSVLVDIPDNDTDYKCTAGNDLGTIESEAVNYDPGRTTTQPPTTELFTRHRGPGSTPTPTGTLDDTVLCSGLSDGATAGMAVLAVLLTISVCINVVLFVLWRRGRNTQGQPADKGEKIRDLCLCTLLWYR